MPVANAISDHGTTLILDVSPVSYAIPYLDATPVPYRCDDGSVITQDGCDIRIHQRTTISYWSTETRIFTNLKAIDIKVVLETSIACRYFLYPRRWDVTSPIIQFKCMIYQDRVIKMTPHLMGSRKQQMKRQRNARHWHSFWDPHSIACSVMMFGIFDVIMVMPESFETSSNKNKMVRCEVLRYLYLRQLVFLRLLQDLTRGVNNPKNRIPKGKIWQDDPRT